MNVQGVFSDFNGYCENIEANTDDLKLKTCNSELLEKICSLNFKKYILGNFRAEKCCFSYQFRYRGAFEANIAHYPMF